VKNVEDEKNKMSNVRVRARNTNVLRRCLKTEHDGVNVTQFVPYVGAEDWK